MIKKTIVILILMISLLFSLSCNIIEARETKIYRWLEIDYELSPSAFQVMDTDRYLLNENITYNFENNALIIKRNNEIIAVYSKDNLIKAEVKEDKFSKFQLKDVNFK